MKEGIIFFNANAKRPDIRFRNGSFYGGLHCGNTIEIFSNGEWHPARVEYRSRTGTWYLAGVEIEGKIYGESVRC